MHFTVRATGRFKPDASCTSDFTVESALSRCPTPALLSVPTADVSGLLLQHCKFSVGNLHHQSAVDNAFVPHLQSAAVRCSGQQAMMQLIPGPCRDYGSLRGRGRASP
jgi:hypothetical protein